MTEPWKILPIECTNIEELANGNCISTDEVYRRKDLHNQIFYNSLAVGIFGLGAIKQLFNKYVSPLIKRVETLEKAKAKQ